VVPSNQKLTMLFNTKTLDSSLVEVEEYEKPWKDDPTKSNKAVKIYLKGQRGKGYFELVKDNEPGNYSIHFKTNNG
jgi:hypothetical protein